MAWYQIIVFICSPALYINIRHWCHQSCSSTYTELTCHWNRAVSTPMIIMVVSIHKDRLKPTVTAWNKKLFKHVYEIQKVSVCACVYVSCPSACVYVLNIRCTFADELSASSEPLWHPAEVNAKCQVWRMLLSQDVQPLTPLVTRLCQDGAQITEKVHPVWV